MFVSCRLQILNGDLNRMNLHSLMFSKHKVHTQFYTHYFHGTFLREPILANCRLDFYSALVLFWKRERERDPFNGPLSRTTRVSRYQKGKPIWILLKQETVSGSGISWAVCKSAPRSRQITTPAPHHSVFYRPDALPAAQPTASKHWRQKMSVVFIVQMPFLSSKQQC